MMIRSDRSRAACTMCQNSSKHATGTHLARLGSLTYKSGVGPEPRLVPDSSTVESRPVGMNRRVVVPDSSTVEQPAVNRRVLGSNPNRGADGSGTISHRAATSCNSC